MADFKYEFTQAKCTKCRVRHTWPANTLKVSDAFCPTCSTKLERTTYQVKLPSKPWPLGLGVTACAHDQADENLRLETEIDNRIAKDERDADALYDQ